MAKIPYSDNQRITENGHSSARFILPSTVDPNDPNKLITRDGACYDETFNNGVRVIRKFNSQRNDVSDNERQNPTYKSDAPDYAHTPRRSMIAHEGDRRQDNVAMKASFRFNWQPDLYAGMPAPALVNSDPKAWHVLFQWNSYPGTNPGTGKQYTWKGAPLSMGVRNIDGAERLVIDINTSTDPTTRENDRNVLLASVPLSRGAHTIDVLFTNGGGRAGKVDATFDGAKIVDNYVGATGHTGHLYSYSAYGWYQHKWPSAPQKPDVNIWFENFQEGLA